MPEIAQWFSSGEFDNIVVNVTNSTKYFFYIVLLFIPLAYTCIPLRIILNIVPKTRDVYSAPSVGIHIFGYALTGVNPKQDGVRSDFFPLNSDYEFLPSFFLSCKLSYLNSEFHIFSGTRTAVSFIKRRMGTGGLNIKGHWFLTGLKR